MGATTNIMICDKCGKEIRIGAWPWCPHETAVGGMLGRFTPYWEEHLVEGPPVWVTSLSERKRLMKAANADYHGKRVGMPGCEI